jgi:hypothetical protein
MSVTQKTPPTTVAITTSKRGLKVIAAMVFGPADGPGWGGNQGWLIAYLRLRRGKQFVESINRYSRLVRAYKLVPPDKLRQAEALGRRYQGVGLGWKPCRDTCRSRLLALL